MFSSRDILPPSRQPCYFSITPGQQTSPTTPPETPLVSPQVQHLDNLTAEPTNPLLSISLSPQAISRSSASKDGSSIIQLQMQASHRQDRRPRLRPSPLQDCNPTSEDMSAQSSSCSINSDGVGCSPVSSSTAARCSRCQRTAAIDVATQKPNMVAYGLNLHYCMRCADIVGFLRRS